MSERKIVDYTVVFDGIFDFDQSVREKMLEWFQPYQGIFIKDDEDGNEWFYQAMVKYED